MGAVLPAVRCACAAAQPPAAVARGYCMMLDCCGAQLPSPLVHGKQGALASHGQLLGATSEAMGFT
jgi:hypothetical protein